MGDVSDLLYNDSIRTFLTPLGTIVFFAEVPSPENVTHPKTQVIDRSHAESAISGVLRFLGCFGALLGGEHRAPENATPPKTQIFGAVRFLRFRVCCALRRFLFSSEP